MAYSGLSETQMTKVLNLFREGHLGVLTGLYSDVLQIVRAKGSVILSELRVSTPVPTHHSAFAAAISRANTGLSTTAANIFRAVGDFSASSTTNRGRRSLETITGGPGCTATELASAEELPRCFGEGWIMAGAWYIHIARLNGQMTSITRANGSAGMDRFFREVAAEGWLTQAWQRVRRWFSGPTAGSYMDQEYVARRWQEFQTAFSVDAQRLAALGFPTDMDRVRLPVDEGGGWSIADLTTKLSGVGLDDAVESLSGLLIDPDSDPLVDLMMWGDLLLTLAGALMVALVLIPGAAVTMPAIGVLWAAGALLQLILPMMPWILWVVAVTGYFLLVVEAVVGVSLWAVNGGGIMLHRKRPVGPVAAVQNCTTCSPLSVWARGGRCMAWSFMQRFDLRLSRRD